MSNQTLIVQLSFQTSSQTHTKMKVEFTCFVLLLLGGYLKIVNASTSSDVKSLCAAGSTLLNVYNQNCVSTTTGSTTAPGGASAKEDGVVRPFCGVVQSRFLSAEDIPESEQKENLERMLGNPTEQGDVCYGVEDRVLAIMTHLHKAVTYFGTLRKLRYSNALMGTRTIQAQIALLLEKLRDVEGRMRLSPSILDKVNELEGYTKDVSLVIEDENAPLWLSADRSLAASYFYKSPHVWKDWDIIGSKDIQSTPYLKNLTHYHRDHETNNECHNRMLRDCDLSQECADILADRSAEITTLGHDLAFFKLAIQLECVEEVQFMEKFQNSNWEIVVEDHCTKMWNEANAVSSAGFPLGFKGLFLIHATSCAMVGYPNFLRVDWANDVMSWMNATENGCIAPDTKDGLGNKEMELESFDAFAPNGEWCTIYETSLGIQFLALHLRYALENCPTI